MWHPLTNIQNKQDGAENSRPGESCLHSVKYWYNLSTGQSQPFCKHAFNGNKSLHTRLLHNIKTFPTDSTVDVKASCWRSMRKSEPPHELLIIIGLGQAQLTDSFCSCRIGRNGKCSHIVGLLKTLEAFKLHGFVRVPQQNNEPCCDKLKPVPINQVVVARPLKTPRKRKFNELPEITDRQLHELRKQLVGTPLGYLLPKETDPPIPRVATSFGLVPLGCIFSYQKMEHVIVPVPRHVYLPALKKQAEEGIQVKSTLTQLDDHSKDETTPTM